MRETQKKGDKGVAHVIAALTDQDWNVSIPISESLKYDLLAEKNDKIVRVQVRYCQEKDGKAEIKLRNIYNDKNGYHVCKHKKGKYDILAAFLPSQNIVIFVSDDEIGKIETAITFRTNPPKSKQIKLIRYAKDYIKIPIKFEMP